MHDDKDRGQHHHTPQHRDIGNHHVLQEQLGRLEVAIHLRVRTNQLSFSHAIHGVQDAVKAHSEVAHVPQPTEGLCDVHISIAEAKDREQDRKHRSYKDGNLNGQSRSREEAPTLS